MERVYLSSVWVRGLHIYMRAEGRDVSKVMRLIHTQESQGVSIPAFTNRLSLFFNMFFYIIIDFELDKLVFFGRYICRMLPSHSMAFATDQNSKPTT